MGPLMANIINTPDDELVAALGQLGFSQYEARAYCALLGAEPMNGHEVARASQIPPSKIYETLARLAEKGAVRVQHSDPVCYSASPWETVKAAARTKFERALSTAQSGLESRPKRDGAGHIWSLRDTDTVLSTALDLIEGAGSSILVSLWDQELVVLKRPLESASARGCCVQVAVYGTTTLSGPQSYDLTLCGNSVLERLMGRRLSTIVVDRCRSLIAEFHQDGSVDAVCTSNPIIGLLVSEYIKSDVLGRLLIDDMGNERFEHLRYHHDRIDILLRS